MDEKEVIDTKVTEEMKPGFFYNPGSWMDCCLAYFAKKEGEEIKEEEEQHTHVVTSFRAKLASEFNYEGKPNSEAATILLNDNDIPTYLSLTEAIQITEFDPATEGGYNFWDNLFSCTSLKEKAKEEGEAFGKWDVLRQAINMGSLVYVGKLNACLAYVAKKGNTDESRQVILDMFGKPYERLMVKEAEKKNVE